MKNTLKQLISEKEKELQNLEDSLDLGCSIIKLNDNQEIVLEWLLWLVKDQSYSSIEAVVLLKSGEALDSVLLALMELNDSQQTEVLAAFAQCVLKQEEEK